MTGYSQQDADHRPLDFSAIYTDREILRLLWGEMMDPYYFIQENAFRVRTEEQAEAPADAEMESWSLPATRSPWYYDADQGILYKRIATAQTMRQQHLLQEDEDILNSSFANMITGTMTQYGVLASRHDVDVRIDISGPEPMLDEEHDMFAPEDDPGRHPRHEHQQCLLVLQARDENILDIAQRMQERLGAVIVDLPD